jgi:hypothetical protein
MNQRERDLREDAVPGMFKFIAGEKHIHVESAPFRNEST